MSFTMPFFSIYGFLNLYTYTITLPTKHCESIKYKLSRDALNERCIYHFKYSFLRPPVNRNEHNQLIEKYNFLVSKKSKIFLVIIFETAPERNLIFAYFLFSLHLNLKETLPILSYNRMNNLFWIYEILIGFSLKCLSNLSIIPHPTPQSNNLTENSKKKLSDSI